MAIVDGRLARNADPVGGISQTGNGRLNIAQAFADTRTKGVTPRGAPAQSRSPGKANGSASGVSVTEGADVRIVMTLVPLDPAFVAVSVWVAVTL